METSTLPQIMLIPMRIHTLWLYQLSNTFCLLFIVWSLVDSSRHTSQLKMHKPNVSVPPSNKQQTTKKDLGLAKKVKQKQKQKVFSGVGETIKVPMNVGLIIGEKRSLMKCPSRSAGCVCVVSKKPDKQTNPPK